MRKLWLVIGGILVVLVALVLIGLEALKSGVGKDRLAATLSAALGQPVSIGGMSLSLFPAPALDATQIRIGSGDREAAPGVAIASLHVVPTISSFLPGRSPTISHLDLVGLVLSVRHDRAGRWLIPVPPTGGAPSAGSPKATLNLEDLRVKDGAIRVVDDLLPSASGAPTVTTIRKLQASLRAVNGEMTAPSFGGQLGATSVTGSAHGGAKGATLHLSSTSIQNADLPSLFALAGMAMTPGLAIAGKAPVEITTSIASDFTTFTVTGKASVERLSMGTLAMQSVQAPFRLAKGVFTIDPFTFSLYGGREKGVVSMDMAPRVPVFTIRSTIDGLDIDQALSANTTMKGMMQGTGALSTDVHASGATEPAIERTLAGTVKYEIKNGVIRNFPALNAINQALGITGGSASDTRFESLTGTAVIADAHARVDDLALHAGELTMLGQGTLGFDRSLAFQMRAQLSPAKSTELAQRVALAKRLENAQGQIELPVSISGSAGAPKFGIDLQTLAKKQLQSELQNQLQGKLKGLLGKP